MTGQDDGQISARPLVVPEVVTFPAEIDLANALELATAVIGAFGPGVAVVIADMTATKFCDAASLRLLTLANDVGAELGAELRLVIPAQSVLRLIRLTAADRSLRIYSSMSEALSGAPAAATEQTQPQPAINLAPQPRAEMPG